jgi:hypothetical protein
MFLKRFISRLTGRPVVYEQYLFARRPGQSPPADACERPVPIEKGPKGRSGAAVAEPEEDSYSVYPPRTQ